MSKKVNSSEQINTQHDSVVKQRNTLLEFIDVIEAEKYSERSRVTASCVSCRMKHCKCSFIKPCKNCIMKGIICIEGQQKKRGGKIKEMKRRLVTSPNSNGTCNNVETVNASYLENYITMDFEAFEMSNLENDENKEINN